MSDLVALGFSFSAGNTESEIQKLIEKFETLETSSGKTEKALQKLFSGGFAARVSAAARGIGKINAGLLQVQERGGQTLPKLSKGFDAVAASVEITNAKIVETDQHLGRIKLEQISPAPLVPVGGELDRLARKAKGTGIALASFFTTTKLVAFGKKSVASYAEQTRAVDMLAASLRRAGDSVSNLPDLQVFSQELEQITRFKSVDTLGNLASLKNFEIPVSQLQEAQRAAIGLSVAFGIRLEQAIRLVGRAASGNTSQLRQYGIILGSTGSAQDRFAELLQIGARNFELAEADARTFSGTMAQVGNSWTRTQEIVGGTFAPGLQEVGGVLKSVLDGFNQLDPAAQRFIVQFGTITAGAVALKTTLAGLNLIQAQTARLTQSQTAASSARMTVQQMEADLSLKVAQLNLAEGESVRQLNVLLAAEAAQRKALLTVKTAEANVATAKQTGSGIEVAAARKEFVAANAALTRYTAGLERAQVASARANIEALKAGAILKQTRAAFDAETGAVKRNSAAKSIGILAWLKFGTAATAGSNAIAASAVKMTLAQRSVIGLSASLRTAGTAAKGLAAALGPIGIALIALQGITALYDAFDLAGKRAVGTINDQISGLDRQRDSLARNRSEMEAYAASAQAGIMNLQQLSQYTELTSTGQQAAQGIVSELNRHYRDLNVTFDETSGKILGLEGAQDRLNQKYQEQLKMSVSQQLAAEQAKLNALREKENAIHSQKMHLIDAVFRASQKENEVIAALGEVDAERLETMRKIWKLQGELKNAGTASVTGQDTKTTQMLETAQREARLLEQLAQKKWQLNFDSSNTAGQLSMIREKIAQIEKAKLEAEQAVAGGLAVPEGEKQSWEEKRLETEMKLIDLQKQEQQALARAAREADKIAQGQQRAFENTLKMVQQMDKFRATTVDAVSAYGLEAMKLQSRRFDALPSISGMFPKRESNSATDGLTASATSASTALDRFSTTLQGVSGIFPSGSQAGVGAVRNSLPGFTAPTFPAAAEAGKKDELVGKIDLSKLESETGSIQGAIAEIRNLLMQHLGGLHQNVKSLDRGLRGIGTVSY